MHFFILLALNWETHAYSPERGNPGPNGVCVCNSSKPLHAPNMYNIYMTFFQKPHFVGTPPQEKKIRGGGARDYQSIWFRTYGHPDFQFDDSLFYPIHVPRDKGSRRRGSPAAGLQKIFTTLCGLQEPSPIGSWMMAILNRMAEPINFRLTHFRRRINQDLSKL